MKKNRKGKSGRGSDNVIPFPVLNEKARKFSLGGKNRFGEKMEIFKRLLDMLPDDNLKVDCMFACLSADKEILTQVYGLLRNPKAPST